MALTLGKRGIQVASDKSAATLSMKRMVTSKEIAEFRAHIRQASLGPKNYWLEERGQLAHLPIHKDHVALVAEVLNGLQQTQKTIAPKFFYDVEGSRLFDRITQQPEYYLTRAEHDLLKSNAGRISQELGDEHTWVELGSGSSTKTRLLLRTWCQQVQRAHYMPVDISRTALVQSVPDLLNVSENLWISALHAEYQGALELLRQRDHALPISILFLGSNIGNLSRDERRQFFRDLVTVVGQKGTIALGVDLEKDRAVLEAAYNDRAGVTAGFNRNVLYHLKRELDLTVEPERFEHHAFYNEREGRIEMHLVSREAQVLHLGGVEIALRAGESIHTESSYKFRIPDLTAELNACGIQLIDIIKDSGDLFSFWICTPSA